jgi:hypothetical protein
MVIPVEIRVKEQFERQKHLVGLNYCYPLKLRKIFSVNISMNNMATRKYTYIDIIQILLDSTSKLINRLKIIG